MTDQWASSGGGIESSIEGVGATTYDTDYTYITRALYVGGAGNVNVRFQDGSEAVLTALAVGVWHPMRVKQVLSASTTVAAALIKAGY